MTSNSKYGEPLRQRIHATHAREIFPEPESSDRNCHNAPIIQEISITDANLVGLESVANELMRRLECVSGNYPEQGKSEGLACHVSTSEVCTSIQAIGLRIRVLRSRIEDATQALEI
jgi:hypothetical protein